MINRLGQLGEFEQESNTNSDCARNKAQAAQWSAAETCETAPQSKEQI